MQSLAPNVTIEQAPSVGISWGNIVGVAAIALFIVYLIVKGRLGIYLGLLLPGTPGGGMNAGASDLTSGFGVDTHGLNVGSGSTPAAGSSNTMPGGGINPDALTPGT